MDDVVEGFVENIGRLKDGRSEVSCMGNMNPWTDTYHFGDSAGRVDRRRRIGAGHLRSRRGSPQVD